MNFKLFYVGETKGMTAEDAGTVEKYIAALEYAIISTSSKDGIARVSGLNHLPGQSLQEFCFATDSDSQKVKNLTENPMCEILYTNGSGSGQVILSGKMEIFTDAETKKSKWKEHMIYHFPDGPDGTFCVLKFKPISVRAMIM
jgi:general stress protein 26